MVLSKNINLCKYPDVLEKDACQGCFTCDGINLCVCNRKCSYRDKGYQISVMIEKRENNVVAV